VDSGAAADFDPSTDPGPPPGPAPEGTITAGFTAELAARLAADFPSCCAGQFMAAARSQRQFLTCLGVHRGMAVFAWAPGRDPRGFAAHLTSGAIRFSLEQRGEFLPEVVRAMCRTFEGVPTGDVLVQIVGDLVGEPLRRYCADMPSISHVCSLHVEAALRKVGFKSIDKDMCAAFEEDPGEEPAPEDKEAAPRPLAYARGDARRFSLASLDLQSGRVIALTSGTVADVKAAAGDRWPLIEAEYERDKSLSRGRSLFSPMTTAGGSSADFWTAYSEAVANPLPWVLLAILVVALLLIAAPQVLPRELQRRPGPRTAKDAAFGLG